MPDILLRGMEMPTMEQAYKTLIISYDGKVYEGVHPQPTAKKKEPIAEAVELPPHGDLIDVSKVVLEYGGLAKISPHDFVGIAKYFSEQIEGQPVVVPAERSASHD